MTETSAIEERIAAALDRISEGMGQLGSAAAETELNALRASLEDERLANAQLTERVKAIKERQETVVMELEGKVRRLGRSLASQEATLVQLRRVNEQLRVNNEALRSANAEGLGDASLINAGLETELAALRAARSAERAELEDVLGSLEPLLGGKSNA